MRSARGPGAARGFTYVGLLIAVAMAGVALATIGSLASTETKRAREEELLFAGRQIRAAIESYTRRHGGTSQPLPRTLDDLIEDRRGPVMVRHLRRVYRDPMVTDGAWALVRDDAGRIQGVHSRSDDAPMRKAGFAADEMDSFPGAKRYAEWRFIAAPVTPTVQRQLPVPPGQSNAGEASPSNPPVQVIAPQVVTPPRPPANRDLSDCGRRRDADLALCAGVERTGDVELARACRESVDARQAACASSEPLPPLVFSRPGLAQDPRLRR